MSLSRYVSLLIESTINLLSQDLGAEVSAKCLHALRRVHTAVTDRRLGAALRLIDAAWRFNPDDADVLAPIYARVMSLVDGDPQATYGLLERVTLPDPEIEAIKARTLLRFGREHEARSHMDRALRAFCVKPKGLLALTASEIVQQSGTEVPGWIGFGPALELVGEINAHTKAPALTVQLDSGLPASRSIAIVLGKPAFRFKLPENVPGMTLRAVLRERPLLGSELEVPTDFGMDGRATAAGSSLSGWARMGWLPTRPMVIRVENERGARCLTRTPRVALPGPRWPFILDLRQASFRGSRFTVSARAPDGRWIPLPDTPTLIQRAVRPDGRKSPPLLDWRPLSINSRGKIARQRPRPVNVIIPVYRGHRESLACLESVLATAGSAPVIVVDDATDDRQLADDLDAAAVRTHITLLRNPTNLGFVASINRALAHEPTHDAVILNSDAVVFGDWLARLQAAAYRNPRTGTVTPFSNSGAIASYRRADGHPLSIEEAAGIHDLAASANTGLCQQIPVGVGFCLYLRRDCLREVGDFDASVFGKGYGEEADFCLRARQKGWSHQLAADVFVYHAGGRSFGTRRAALLERSSRLLNLRHPGYDRCILDFMARDPLRGLRRRLDERRLLAQGGRLVLLVTLAMTGGVQRFVAERCRDIAARGLTPLLLRPSKLGDPASCELWTDTIDVPDLRYEIPSEIGRLRGLLRRLGLVAVEIQHFLHINPRVIDMVRSLGVPYDAFIHDYAWICPRITLIDHSGRYCGEPAVSVCNACIRRNGSHLGGDRISVRDLRRRSVKWLRQARSVSAPSSDCATRMARYVDRPITIRGHTQSRVRPILLPRPQLHQVVRIAVIGAIGEHKGYRVLLNCARDARKRSLPMEFVVVGFTENDKPLIDTGKVFITGQYSEGEAAHLLQREKPDLALLPSVWPETWCYALDEPMALGIPVVAFDLGAIEERLRSTEVKLLLPLGLAPRHINHQLLDFAAALTSSGRRTANDIF